MNKVKKHTVQIIESERGWGSKVDDEVHFDTEREATEWTRAYNVKYNSEATVPDWYMYASYVGEREVYEEQVQQPYKV